MQQLLFPERVECTEVESGARRGPADALARLGLDCTLLGPTTVAVHAVPALLTRAAPERLLRDVLGELERAGGRAFSGGDRPRARDDGLPRRDPRRRRALDRAGRRRCCATSTRSATSPATARTGGRCVHAIPLDELERKLGR